MRRIFFVAVKEASSVLLAEPALDKGWQVII